MNPIGGSKLYIGLRVAGKSEVTEADFIGQDWLEIGGLVTLGSLGDSQEVVSQAVLSGRLGQVKGTVTGQVMENTFIPIWNDPGQQRFLAAMESCSPYAFKVEWSEGCEDDPIVDMFYGLAMPGSRAGGDANTAQLRSWAIAVDSNVVEAPFIWDSMPYLLFLGGVKGTSLDYSVVDSRFQDVLAATPALALDDPVARWNDQGPNGMFATTSSDSTRPLVKTDGLLFDGSNDNLRAMSRQTLSEISSFVAPDLSDSTPGKGFTNTGMTLDTTDDTLWLANEGRTNSSDLSWRPSLVNITKTGTFISEVPLLVNFPSMVSLQDIEFDDSDNTIWLASLTENMIRQVARDGSSISSFAASTPNGITIDPVNDHVIVGKQDGSITVYDKTGVQLFTRPSSGIVKDMLKYDHTTEILYYSSDETPNYIGMIHYPTWQPLGRLDIYPSVDAVEGFVFDDDTLFVNSDAYMHTGLSNLNEVVLFNVPSPPAYSPSEQITLFGRAKLTAAPASFARPLFAIGDGTTYGGVSLYGVVGSTTSLRLDINPTAQSGTLDQFTFTGLPSLTTVRAFVVEIDIGAGTAKLFVDGVQYGGTKALVNATAGIAGGLFSTATRYAGGSTLSGTIQKAGFGTTIYNPAMRAKLDDWLST